jgi:hypothetical protein
MVSSSSAARTGRFSLTVILCGASMVMLSWASAIPIHEKSALREADPLAQIEADRQAVLGHRPGRRQQPI